jgi:hypothetical protein
VIRHQVVEPVAPHVPRPPRERPAPAEAGPGR